MSEKTIKDWTVKEIVALRYLKAFKGATLFSIVDKFSSFDSFLSSNSRELKAISQGFFEDEIDSALKKAEIQIELSAEKGFEIISFWDEKYPSLLKEISYPPPVLFVWGELQDPDAVCVAIVGTRKNDYYGKFAAEKFASELAASGVVVVSGLARGADTIAHLAAVEAGGKTYAVVASGLDKISPFVSRKNAEKIVESGGAIISEYDAGVSARPGYFPRRNRIISGISKATIVVQSGLKGGSLITANFAISQGRDLYAVPGDIRSPKCAGTNALIKKKMAELLLDSRDLLEDLGFKQAEKSSEEEELNLSETEEKLFSVINYEPIHYDELIYSSRLDPAQLSVDLLNLEFKGLIKQLPGKYFIKAK